MKRIKVLLILVFCLAVSLAAAACGNTTSASEKPAESSGTGSESASKPTSESTSVSCSHNFVEVSEEAPTCEKAGVKHFECSVCHETKTESFGKALGHDFGEWEVVNAATCTEAGLKSRECRRENCEKYETEEIKPSHSYTLDEEQSVAPTCEEAGKKVFVCVCGESYENAVPPLGHLKDESVAPVITAPTCEEAGYTVYHCNRAGCGKDYRADEVEALGHNHEAKTPVAASCKTGGYTEYKCSRCDDSYRTYSSTKLAHAFNSDGVCETCGEDYLEAVAVDSSSENKKSYAVKDEKYGYVVYLEDDGSTIARITLDKTVIEQLVANRYYNVTVKFGCPDRSYRSFAWRFGKTEESDGIFSAGNCFTLEGFNDTCLFKLVLGDENGVGEKFKYTYVENDATKTVELPYGENGIEFEVWYTYFGDEKVAPATVTEDRKSNPLAYNGTLNDFAMKLELEKTFNPNNLNEYVSTEEKYVLDGSTFVFTAEAGKFLTIRPEAIAYWLEKGYTSVSMKFMSKIGQATTFDVLVNGEKPVTASHRMLTIYDYALTEQTAASGIKIQPYYGNFVDGKQNENSDGYYLQITFNKEFDAGNKASHIKTGLIYDYSDGVYTVKAGDSWETEIKLVPEEVNYLLDNGYDSISLKISDKAGQRMRKYITVNGNKYGTNAEVREFKYILLTEEMRTSGLTFVVQGVDLKKESEAWHAEKYYDGFLMEIGYNEALDADVMTQWIVTDFEKVYNESGNNVEVIGANPGATQTEGKVTIDGRILAKMRESGKSSFIVTLKRKAGQYAILGLNEPGYKETKYATGDIVGIEQFITDDMIMNGYVFKTVFADQNQRLVNEGKAKDENYPDDVNGFYVEIAFLDEFDLTQKQNYISSSLSVTYNQEVGYVEVTGGNPVKGDAVTTPITVNNRLISAMYNQGYVSFTVTLRPKANKLSTLGIHDGAWKWSSAGCIDISNEYAITQEMRKNGFSFTALYNDLALNNGLTGYEAADGFFIDVKFYKEFDVNDKTRWVKTTGDADNNGSGYDISYDGRYIVTSGKFDQNTALIVDARLIAAKAAEGYTKITVNFYSKDGTTAAFAVKGEVEKAQNGMWQSGELEITDAMKENGVSFVVYYRNFDANLPNPDGFWVEILFS